MSLRLRLYGMSVAAAVAFAGLAAHTQEQAAVQHTSTVQADSGDGLIWD
ncbi:hypothetical protein [Streptomyces sp. NPDC101455]